MINAKHFAMAVVLCNECYQSCVYSASFVAVVAQHHSKRLGKFYYFYYVMAEASDSQVQSKKRRSTSDRGIQFFLNVKLPCNQESRLLGIKERIGMAKTSLNLSKGTSSTQNADLLEALLLAFEEKMQG